MVKYIVEIVVVEQFTFDGGVSHFTTERKFTKTFSSLQAAENYAMAYDDVDITMVENYDNNTLYKAALEDLGL